MIKRQVLLTVEVGFSCITDAGNSFRWRSVLYFPPAIKRFNPLKVLIAWINKLPKFDAISWKNDIEAVLVYAWGT